jgi:peptide/nickel transport system permease protein
VGTSGLASFVVRRLLLSVLVVILASVVTFALVASSGDPLAGYRANPHAHQAAIKAIERQLHLDRPIPVRYAIWAGGLLHGDLGRSVKEDDPVAGMVWRATGVTARLVCVAIVLALALAVAIGALSAARHHSWIDHAGTVVSFVLLSIPAFWLGWILRDLAVHLNAATGTKLLFFVGERSTVSPSGALGSAGDRARHLALPALTLSLLAAAGWSRFLRSSMLDALGGDFVRTARAKGMPEWRVVGHHALRPSLVPLTTVVALNVAGIIGGAVVIESLFTWPGLGTLLLRGVQTHDANVVSGCLLVAGVAVVVLNLAADIACAVLDPRTRRG